MIVRQSDGWRHSSAFYNVMPASRQIAIALNERSAASRRFHLRISWLEVSACNGQVSRLHHRRADLRAPKLVAHRPGLTEVRCDHARRDSSSSTWTAMLRRCAEWIGLPPGYLENYQHRPDARRPARALRLACELEGRRRFAFYETYHLPHIHPQTQGVMERLLASTMLYPNGFQSHDRAALHAQKSHAGSPTRKRWTPACSFMMHRRRNGSGLEFKGSARWTCAWPYNNPNARVPGGSNLAHYDNLVDGQLTDSWATGLFPERADRHAIRKACSSCASSRTRPTRSASSTTT